VVIDVSAEFHRPARVNTVLPFHETVELRALPDTSLLLELVPTPEPDVPARVPLEIDVAFLDTWYQPPRILDFRSGDVDEARRCLLRFLPSGRPHIVVRARPEGWYLPAEADVELRYGERKEAAVRIARGGKIHIEARENGENVVASFQVLNSSGVEHAAGFTTGRGESVLLEPGDYQVIVRKGSAVRRLPAKVVAAKTTRLVVEVAPK
jgi:hypothetical protein